MSARDDDSHRAGARHLGGWRPPSATTHPRSDPPVADAPAASRDAHRTAPGRSPGPGGTTTSSRSRGDSRPASVAGEVRGLDVTTLAAPNGVPVPVVTFRVEGRDPNGTPTGTTPVRLRGDAAVGFADDGDWVEVTGERRDGVLLGRRGRNTTTGAIYKGSVGMSRSMKIAVTVVFLAVVAIGIAFAVRAVQQSDAGFQQQIEQDQQDFQDEQQRQEEQFREDSIQACIDAGFPQDQCEATVG